MSAFIRSSFLRLTSTLDLSKSASAYTMACIFRLSLSAAPFAASASIRLHRPQASEHRRSIYPRCGRPSRALARPQPSSDLLSVCQRRAPLRLPIDCNRRRHSRRLPSVIPCKAARRFLALVTYDTQSLDGAELDETLKANVRFFLHGYGSV